MASDNASVLPHNRLAHLQPALRNNCRHDPVQACERCGFRRLCWQQPVRISGRSEEHTSELQSLMRISYAVFCLKKKTKNCKEQITTTHNKDKNTPRAC